jgi:hypothetical protein
MQQKNRKRSEMHTAVESQRVCDPLLFLLSKEVITMQNEKENRSISKCLKRQGVGVNE